MLAECRLRSMVRVNGAPEPGVLAGALGASDADVAPNRTFDVQVVKSADEAFRLYVFRSFGLAMWEMLHDEAAEFGGEIVPAG